MGLTGFTKLVVGLHLQLISGNCKKLEQVLE